jgi:two-component system CheB/CheR fusion protein
MRCRSARAVVAQRGRRGAGRRLPLIARRPTAPERPLAAGRRRAPSTRGSVHLRLIERYSPPSLVVDGDFELVHLSQRAGRYLRFGGGEPSRNLLRIAHPMLRIELRAALNRVVQTGEPTEVLDLPVELDGRSLLIDLSVAPADEIAPQCLLVVFNERLATPVSGEARHGAAEEPRQARTRALRRGGAAEAAAARSLRAAPGVGEELQASNEELQTMNEDLRSAGREIDTRRQEAASVNEELATVGVELRRTIEEIGASNSDLHNVMASLPMAMVFSTASAASRSTRHPPSAVQPDSDRCRPSAGRPDAPLPYRISRPTRSACCGARRVEGEVGDDAGRWFLARLQPYRTIEDRSPASC